MRAETDAARLVHALRGQLNVIQLTCEVIERIPWTPGGPDPRLAQVCEAVDRATGLVERLVAAIPAEVLELPAGEVPAVETLSG
jgi:hypothetical protein